jgi:hypothetical protein
LDFLAKLVSTTEDTADAEEKLVFKISVDSVFTFDLPFANLAVGVFWFTGASHRLPMSL